MIVCSCNVISDAMIKAALDPAEGKRCPSTPSAVYKCLGCSPCCGRCFVTAREIIDEMLRRSWAPTWAASSCDGLSEGERVAPFDRPAAQEMARGIDRGDASRR